MKYSIVTFGCRVNQADSLRLEEDLRARGGAERASRRRRRGRREHVLGDRDRGSGRAPDDPPHRARESRTRGSSSPAATRRGAQTRSPRSRRRPRRRATTRSSTRSSLDSMPSATAGDSRTTIATATARAARRSSPGSRDGPRSRCACRPAARSAAPTASSRRRAARRGACPSRTSSARSSASRRPASRKSRSRASISDRTAATCRRASSLCRAAARARSRCAATSRSGSARSSRWTARRRSSISSRSSGRFAPHFHLPLQHASDRDAARDAAAVHARRLPPARRPHRRAACRTPRSASDMIVGFPGRDRRGLRREPRLPALVAADAPARVPVFRSSGHRGVGDARQGRRSRSSAIAARALRAIGAELTRRFHAVAARHRPSGPDARGRHAGRDRQLPEGANPAGAAAERAGDR